MTAVLPGTVVITRPRHPLQGRELRVLGSMRRHGARELLVVLPDGSKRLVPASWTDLEPAAGAEAGDRPGTLGSVADLLGLSVLVSALCARSRRNGSRLHETHLPGRMIVQPVQLSLLPDQVPAPPPDLIGQFPGPQVEAAITLLAGLIARAQAAGVTGEAGDE